MLQRRVRHFQAQPEGLRPGLRPAALSVAHVERLHLASSALPAHNPGLSSGEDERSTAPSAAYDKLGPKRAYYMLAYYKLAYIICAHAMERK